MEKEKIKESNEIIAEHKKQEAIEKSHSKTHPIKEKQVNELIEKINKSRTLMLVSIKGLPSKQFQDIKKTIREEAEVKVARKNIMMRAINGLKKDTLSEFKEYIKENCAFVISESEGYELAGIIDKKKTPANAKAGQTAPDNIEIPAGPTSLVPGPAISELGALGIQVAVENGKISIKEPKVVVKENGEITEAVASLLQKLDIKPFKVGLIPLVIYDVQEDKVYTNIKINPDEAKSELISSANKALGFAQKIVYFCKETIGYFLAKANMHGEYLSNLQLSEKNSSENKNESVEEKPSEEKSEKTESEDSENKTQLNKPEEKA